MNIVICDDEKAIREQINELIEKEKAGICPDLYETGGALLAAGRKFDIVFLDIQMEGTDGIETAKKLRDRNWGYDGSIDYVGIVEKCENGTAYTVEGNSGDACRQQIYSAGGSSIYGYGLTAY